MASSDIRVGIIGGTGLGEALGALGTGEVLEVDTPFGKPASPITLAEVEGVPVALLSRHGEGHLLSPSRVPYRANLYALKSLGVTHVFASGAVGSLQEEIAPRDLVVPDQVIDRTFRRPATFFEELSVHVELAHPFCRSMREALISSEDASEARVHPSATYVCMEGPQLSTRAESLAHRQMGGHLIGMTCMPEAKLAREAELCYALVALPTDYDSWRPAAADDQEQLIAQVMQNLKAVTQSGLSLIRRAIPRVPQLSREACRCHSALALGIWSDKRKANPEVWDRLAPLLGKYRPTGH